MRARGRRAGTRAFSSLDSRKGHHVSTLPPSLFISVVAGYRRMVSRCPEIRETFGSRRPPPSRHPSPFPFRSRIEAENNPARRFNTLNAHSLDQLLSSESRLTRCPFRGRVNSFRDGNCERRSETTDIPPRNAAVVLQIYLQPGESR